MRAAARAAGAAARASGRSQLRALESGARTVATAAAVSGSASSWFKAGAGAAALGAAALLALPASQSPAACAAAHPPLHGVPGTPGERTFLMVKPDGVARGVVHEIIRRWEQRGFTLVGIKVLQPDRALAEAHYADLSARPFFKGLVEYMSSSGPVVAMVWQGKDVIKTSRVMIGTTNPLVSPPGTVRGDLAVNVGRNIIHGSDGEEGAKSEIPLWFKEGELINIDSTKWPQHAGLYLYDVSQS